MKMIYMHHASEWKYMIIVAHAFYEFPFMKTSKQIVFKLFKMV